MFWLDTKPGEHAEESCQTKCEVKLRERQREREIEIQNNFIERERITILLREREREIQNNIILERDRDSK